MNGKYVKPKTTITLDSADIALLRSVISFASESETHTSDDAELEKLYRRLEKAAWRILRQMG